MKKNFYTLIFAQNYVTYHSSMYSEFFKKSKRKSIVIYEDNSGKSNKIEKRWNSKVKWGIDITKGFKSLLIKNYSKDPHSAGFFSRINPGIPFIIRKVRPEKVFFQGYSDLSSWLTLIFSVLFKVRSINWKGERVLKKGENIPWIKKFILKNFFFFFCDEIFYSCQGNLKYLKALEIKNKKLKPMNCSVNNNYFNYRYKTNLKIKERLKKKLKIDQDNKVVILVTNFEKRKNIISTLRVIPNFKEKKIKFMIVGSGNFKKDINLFKNIFRDKIILPGFIDIKRISEYYSISDLFIILSTYDPSPKTLNEAMNFGLPCIVSDNIGTAKDLIKDGINGFILNNTNKYKVLNYINRILSDENFVSRSKIFNKNKLALYSPEQNANVLFQK
jgi:glycosyltransferase involved in cell wall biosynthesis